MKKTELGFTYSIDICKGTRHYQLVMRKRTGEELINVLSGLIHSIEQM